jgi:hypothetical protein|tara:strand:- start:16022 stop:16444 length:423 start_codon:yes stop_codon:yes gene_type:complete
MGQRVNIQYSVEIDELGIEVARLFTHAHKKLYDVSANSNPPTDLLSLGATEYIDDLRLKMAAIDHSLNDINVIIGSYLAYKASLLVTPETTDVPPIDPEQLSRMEEIVRGTTPQLPTLEEVLSQHRSANPAQSGKNEEST